MVFGIDSLPGNPINVSNYVTLRPNRLVFVEDNYTTEATITVNTDRETFSPSSLANAAIFAIARFCHVLYLCCMQGLNPGQMPVTGLLKRLLGMTAAV